MFKVLIIDDEESTRRALGRTLRSDGYHVLTAKDGKTGVELFTQEKPPIVLTDIKMPGIDGIEVLKRIKVVDNEVEVIVITGYGDMDSAIAALKYGASDFITKPIRDEVLALALSRAREKIAITQELKSYTENLEHKVEEYTLEIREAQNKLIQAEKLAALGRLTAEIAHEIRNPLTALGGFARRLQRRLQKVSTNEKEKEYAGMVVEQVDRLENILKDVLTFSRDARFHFERKPVTETVRACLSMFAAICKDHSIRVEVEFGTDLPVLMDAEQTRQAVNNLISNAIDAMPDGGTLRVRTVAEELHDINYVAIHISDTGPGIDNDQLPFIFEPFHTTKEIGHGTGLGLSISRKIIEEHGGFIKAENRAQGGVTVSLYFPYQNEEELTKTPCWEFMKCGRDVDKEAICPAYPNFGRVCWVVGGTFCEGKIQGTFAQKCEDCTKCEFYKKVQNKEL
jgi:signal transduction histidine kinase